MMISIWKEGLGGLEEKGIISVWKYPEFTQIVTLICFVKLQNCNSEEEGDFLGEGARLLFQKSDPSGLVYWIHVGNY